MDYTKLTYPNYFLSHLQLQTSSHTQKLQIFMTIWHRSTTTQNTQYQCTDFRTNSPELSPFNCNKPTCIRCRGFCEALSRLRFWCIWSCTMSEKRMLAVAPPGGLAGAKRCQGLSGGLEAGGGSEGVEGMAWGWDGMRIGRPQLWQNKTCFGSECSQLYV